MSRLRRFLTRGLLEAGCDEAGRGCLAGPVFAAAVILPQRYRLPQLNDSKKLTEEQRDALRVGIERQAITWAVASVEPEEIDKINILNASFKAMHLAIEQLEIPPEMLLIDGNRFTPYPGIPHTCVVKGDAKFSCIAAASILAKTHRDAHMRTLHTEFPDYDWESNKGYPTLAHREGIKAVGASVYHRASFQLLPDTQLSLFEDA